MWTQHSFLRTLGSIIIFNKNDTFGKNVNFRKFKNPENPTFFRAGPASLFLGPDGPQGK